VDDQAQAADDPTAHTETLRDLRDEIELELPEAPARPARAAAPIAEDDGEDGVDTLVGEIEELGDDPTRAASLSADEWADLWELAFGVTADALGPHIEIASKRAKRLGHYTQKVFTRYGGDPEKIGKHMPLIALVLLFIGTVFGKVMAHRKVLRAQAPTLELHRGTAGRTEQGAGEVTT